MRRGLAASLLMLTTFSVAAASLVNHRQLGYLGGIADRWFALGIDLACRGVFGLSGEPTVFKPPGYPVFIATVLRVTRLEIRPADERPHFAPTSALAGVEARYAAEDLEAAARRIYWAQAFTLALAAPLLFFWLVRSLGTGLAFAAALAVSVNPVSLVFVGMLHYTVPYALLLVACCCVLEKAVNAQRQPLPFLLAGVGWGVATLIRPVSLLLPFFVGAGLLLRRVPCRAVLVRTGTLTLGMALAILPWSARNFGLTGRLIPVNAQGWTALWAATVQKSSPDPDHYRWKEIREPYLELLQRVPGPPLRAAPNGVAGNLVLEDTARQEVLTNLRTHPEIYLGNALLSFASFQLQSSTILIGLYQSLAKPRATLADWYWPGADQAAHPQPVRRAFSILSAILTALALTGLWQTLRRRDVPLLGSAWVYLCLGVAHSLTWMDLMYYPVKWPFLVVFAFVALRQWQRSPPRFCLHRGPAIATAVGYAVAAAAVGLTLATML